MFSQLNESSNRAIAQGMVRVTARVRAVSAAPFLSITLPMRIRSETTTLRMTFLLKKSAVRNP